MLNGRDRWTEAALRDRAQTARHAATVYRLALTGGWVVGPPITRTRRGTLVNHDLVQATWWRYQPPCTDPARLHALQRRAEETQQALTALESRGYRKST